MLVNGFARSVVRSPLLSRPVLLVFHYAHCVSALPVLLGRKAIYPQMELEITPAPALKRRCTQVPVCCISLVCCAVLTLGVWVWCRVCFSECQMPFAHPSTLANHMITHRNEKRSQSERAASASGSGGEDNDKAIARASSEDGANERLNREERAKLRAKLEAEAEAVRKRKLAEAAAFNARLRAEADRAGAESGRKVQALSDEDEDEDKELRERMNNGMRRTLVSVCLSVCLSVGSQFTVPFRMRSDDRCVPRMPPSNQAAANDCSHEIGSSQKPLRWVSGLQVELH
jgi:hypothetical protein